MSSRPKPRHTFGQPDRGGRTGGYLAVGRRDGARHVLNPGGLARRRWLITASKLMLPAVALLLLASIALWPEFNRGKDTVRLSAANLSVGIDGARVTDAHYNGVDEHGRPYTVTAATAIQKSEDRVDLASPVADMTLENGTWLHLRAVHGVYARKDQQLDLSGDVVLYRDDGTTMTTASATMDLRAGAASGAEKTHIEGPFGTLDAEGFITLDKGAAIQFTGPAQVTLNGGSR